MSEQVLKALGVEVCADLIANRGLLAALFSPISADFFMEVGLGHRQRSLQICGIQTSPYRQDWHNPFEGFKTSCDLPVSQAVSTGAVLCLSMYKLPLTRGLDVGVLL